MFKVSEIYQNSFPRCTSREISLPIRSPPLPPFGDPLRPPSGTTEPCSITVISTTHPQPTHKTNFHLYHLKRLPNKHPIPFLVLLPTEVPRPDSSTFLPRRCPTPPLSTPYLFVYGSRFRPQVQTPTIETLQTYSHIYPNPKEVRTKRDDHHNPGVTYTLHISNFIRLTLNKRGRCRRSRLLGTGNTPTVRKGGGRETRRVDLVDGVHSRHDL